MPLALAFVVLQPLGVGIIDYYGFLTIEAKGADSPNESFLYRVVINGRGIIVSVENVFRRLIGK